MTQMKISVLTFFKYRIEYKTNPNPNDEDYYNITTSKDASAKYYS